MLVPVDQASIYLPADASCGKKLYCLVGPLHLLLYLIYHDTVDDTASDFILHVSAYILRPILHLSGK